MTNFTDLALSVQETGCPAVREHIIQYSYYDNETAGDQFITFIVSHRTLITNWAEENNSMILVCGEK